MKNTYFLHRNRVLLFSDSEHLGAASRAGAVITSYSIHYTKLYENVSNTSFWPQVTEIIESKFHEGYLEYNWKNPDETRERIKVGYIKYFEPLDLVIWASAYKSEFSSLIDKKDFRDDIISAGSIFNSYGFVLDSSGKLIIHPEQENSYNFV